MFKKKTTTTHLPSATPGAGLSHLIQFCLLGFVLSAAAPVATAGPADGPLARTSYDVLVGDVNGDGRQDILMKAKPRIVPIPLDDDLTIPLVIPPGVSSFALLSDPYWGYALVSNPDPQLLQSGWSAGNYSLQYGPNGQLSDTVKISGAAGEFVVALPDATKQLSLVQLPGASKNPGTVTYIHTDGLGSPVARTDAAGNLISRTLYEPYGYVAAGATPTVGFTGHVNDANTGLTYMQQRYYDPVAGRFLSIDPVTTNPNTGASFNRYAYANNNPYKFIDPDGRCPVEKDGVVCKAEIQPGIKISDSKLVDGLNKIAAELNKKIDVYSGDRDPTKNAKVGGAKNSAHTQGKGADVKVSGMNKRQTAEAIFKSEARAEAGIRQVYHLPNNGKLPEHTHLDTLSGPDLQQNVGGKYGPLTVFDDKP